MKVSTLNKKASFSRNYKMFQMFLVLQAALVIFGLGILGF